MPTSAISHHDRVLFPAAGATKLDLARYYEQIGEWMLPDLVDRPLTLVHCPKGLPAGGARKGIDCMFLKHAKAWGPSALRRVRIREKTKVGEYLIADSLAALISLAQMNVLEVHTWNSRFAHVEQPDRVVVDLDPGDQVTWSTVVDGAVAKGDAGPVHDPHRATASGSAPARSVGGVLEDAPANPATGRPRARDHVNWFCESC